MHTFTFTIADCARILGADDAPLTAAAVLDMPAGEYRWEADPCILTMDVVLSAWGGKVVFESGGFGHRALPLTFQAAMQSGPAHDGASPVGRVESLVPSGLRVTASGVVIVGEADDDPGRAYALALANETFTNVSVDVAALSSTDTYVLDNEGYPIDVITNCHEWQIGALTAVNMGADPDARVRLVNMAADPEMPEVPEDEAEEPDDEEDAEPMAAGAVWAAAGHPIVVQHENGTVTCRDTTDAAVILEEGRQAVERLALTPLQHDGVSIWRDEHARVLTAAAHKAPAAAWFDNPHLDRVTPLQVSADGRVSGHIAPWSQPGDKRCHVGFADRCVCAPKSPDGEYPYFLTGEVACADGSRRAVGRIALYGGHHQDDGRIPWTQVAALYDDVRNLGALVNVGEDEHGLWAAGCVAPGMGDVQTAELAASSPSGHWRRVQGDRTRAQRLIAAVQVLSPGYPIASLAASAVGGPHVATVAGPTALYDDEGLVVLTAATGTGTLAAAKEPVTRDEVARLTEQVATLGATVADQGRLLDLLDGPAREAALERLG